MGSKGVALVVAVIGVIALAAAGIYLYRHHGPVPHAGDKVATGEKPALPPAEPAKPAETKPAPSGPKAVPSFDVVRIEPTGDGVIAGRAEPGWTIVLEDSGNKIAETVVDNEGAWSIVLDQPLSPGDHALTLRAMSADKTQGLTGQQPVKVAVAGKPSGEAVVAQKETPAAQAPTPQGQPQPVYPSGAPSEQQAAAEHAKPEPQAAAEPQAVPGQPEPVVPDANAPPPKRPKPPVKIGKLDYQDTSADKGKITMSGVGDPDLHIFLFFDEQPLGEAVVGSDGTWSFEADKKLAEGEHTIRADTYDEKTGMVAGRASIKLGREAAPEAAPAATAQAEPPSGQPQPVYPEGQPAAEAASPAPAATAEAGQPAGQPQPVYPDGPPADLGAASSAPSSAVAAAPQDLSRQPKPVYPGEETAEAESATPEPEAAVAEAPTFTRPQPQPAYPEGAPADLGASSSYPQVAGAPQDLSSQPQPVYAPEPASTATAAAEPAPAEPGAPQSEPAPAEPSGAVTAETPSATKPAEEKHQAPVVFKSVDYEDTGADSGRVALSGTGEPGVRIFLYADQTPLGEVSVGDDGTWTFEGTRKLGTGEHKFRAEGVEPGTNIVVGSASIGIMRMEPPKQEVAEAPPAPPAATPPAAESAPQGAAPSAPAAPEGKTAAAEEGEPAIAEKGAMSKPHRPRVYTVRRGDTLWEIAEAYYGGGWHYRAIVRDNRRKIRNPHWIYPKQKFHMPAR
jgi:hypothetical protein